MAPNTPQPDIIAPPLVQQPGSQPHFGRLKLFDPRSLNYPMSLGISPVKQLAKYSRTWKSKWQGDQGAHSYCTAYALLHWWEMEPVVHFRNRSGPWKGSPVPMVDPRVLYCEAQQLDPWEGGCGADESKDSYEGTSVTAMMKAGANRGWVKEYHWEYKNVDVVVQAILNSGPVIIGVDWYRDMMLTKPQRGKFYTLNDAILYPTGGIVGGHATVLSGVNLRNKGRELTVFNSWGPDWGFHGKAFMSLDTLEKLMLEDGEVCLATETP